MGRWKKNMATLSQMQTAAMDKSPMDEDELRAVFQALDSDPPTGTIKADEFKKSLKIFGGDQAFNDEEIRILEAEMGMEKSGVFHNGSKVICPRPRRCGILQGSGCTPGVQCGVQLRN